MHVDAASKLAQLALAAVRREYPHKLDHVVRGPETISHRELHPAFYGAFDWHSAVHGHWTLARLLLVTPELPEADDIRTVLDKHFTVENFEREAAYCYEHPGFERMYG